MEQRGNNKAFVCECPRGFHGDTCEGKQQRKDVTVRALGEVRYSLDDQLKIFTLKVMLRVTMQER